MRRIAPLILLALYIPFKLFAICTLREWWRDLVKELPTITENNNVAYKEATDGSLEVEEDSIEY